MALLALLGLDVVGFVPTRALGSLACCAALCRVSVEGVACGACEGDARGGGVGESSIACARTGALFLIVAAGDDMVQFLGSPRRTETGSD